jgi:hypothetical protein
VRDLLVLLVAVIVGFFLLAFDQRTDDTGVEAGLILALSLALTLAAPRRWIAIGLGVSLPIAAASALNGRVDVAAVVLVIAMVGAGLAWLMRRRSAAAR